MVAFESLLSGISARHRAKLQVRDFDSFKDTIRDLHSRGKGVIVVTGHLGNWELVAKYSADATEETFYALAKPSKASFMTAFLDRVRGAMNIKFFGQTRKLSSAI